MKLFKTLSTLSLTFAMFGGSLVLVPSEANAAGKVGGQVKNGGTRGSIAPIHNANKHNDAQNAKSSLKRKGRDSAKNLI